MIKRLIMILFLTLASISEASEPPVVRLSLKDALQMAHERNAQVIMADERVTQSLARLGQASSYLLPHLSAGAGGSRQTRDLRSQGISFPNSDPHIGPFNSFDGRLKITQTIFDAGAMARLNAAGHSRELTQAEQLKVQEDVMALVAALYMNARRAKESLRAAKAVMSMEMKHWRLTRQQLSQGIASQLDVDVAKNSYASSYAQWRKAQVRRVQTHGDLCAALDLPAAAVIEFASSDGIPDQMPADFSIDRHPDVQVARHQLSVLTARKNAEAADWLPKFSALGDYGASGSDFDESSTTYTVGLQATVPLWEGGLRGNKIKEAASQEREGQAHLAEVKRESDARLGAAAATLKQSEALVRETQAHVKVVKTRLGLAQERLTIGSGTWLDVVDAETDYAQAVDMMQEAQSAYTLSKINLAHAMGRMSDLLTMFQQQENL